MNASESCFSLVFQEDAGQIVSSPIISSTALLLLKADVFMTMDSVLLYHTSSLASEQSIILSVRAFRARGCSAITRESS